MLQVANRSVFDSRSSVHQGFPAFPLSMKRLEFTTVRKGFALSLWFIDKAFGSQKISLRIRIATNLIQIAAISDRQKRNTKKGRAPAF